MYEGRTRGKRLKYTYSDDEDLLLSDEGPSRRSARNASNTVTPAEPSRPRFTASGRQIRSRAGGLYGEALLTGQREDSEEEAEESTRPQRSRTARNSNGYSGYAADDLEEESDAASTGNDSGNDWNGIWRSGREGGNGGEIINIRGRKRIWKGNRGIGVQKRGRSGNWGDGWLGGGENVGEGRGKFFSNPVFILFLYRRILVKTRTMLVASVSSIAH